MTGRVILESRSDGTVYSPAPSVTPVTRLDSATSWGESNNVSYSVSSGTNRALLVGVQIEAGTSYENSITVTYGGQSMTKIAQLFLDSSVDNEVYLFMLLDSGITAASGTTINVSHVTVFDDWTLHAISYENVNQGGGISTVPQTSSASANASTPNPLTTADLTVSGGSAVVSLAGCGNATTADWTSGDLTEQTYEQDTTSPTTTGSMADGLFSSGQLVDIECTWGSQNRALIIAVELAGSS